ncbi:MAG TPA: glycosyltransferase family 2 protein [Sphingobacteriaceae bacterium]
MDKTVCILMATYNGSLYITEQIDSLLKQEYTNWKLFVRDDGSIDNTPQIIKTYCEKDSRIILLPNGRRQNLGSCRNFSALLEEVKGEFEYYMFCDQDDLWLPRKVGNALDVILSKEKALGTKVPILVYTDFIYADKNLKILDKKVNVGPLFQNDPLQLFKGLFLQNPVYGCTTLFNRALFNKIINIPESFKFHDYWTAFAAAATGYAFHIPDAQILYRQHPKNVTSVYAASMISARIRRGMDWRGLYGDLQNKAEQIRIIRERFSSELSDEKKALADEFLKLAPRGGFKLMKFLIKNRIFPRSASNSVLTLLLLFAGLKSDQPVQNKSEPI